jgi:hypothetical protein
MHGLGVAGGLSEAGLPQGHIPTVARTLVGSPVRAVTRRHLLVMGALLTLVCITASGAQAQDRNSPSSSDRNGVVSPVVDASDIRFLRFSVDDAPRSRIATASETTL